MPHQELAPVAKFFADLEISSDAIPDTLVCAKQMILNKPGTATPLNKRLITVLPACCSPTRELGFPSFKNGKLQ